MVPISRHIWYVSEMYEFYIMPLYCNIKRYYSCMLLFLDGVPYDGLGVNSIHPNNLCLQIIYYIMASFGMIFAGVCLVFNIVFRERK